MVTAIVGGIVSLFTSWFSNQREKTKARHERDLAVIKGKQKLAEGSQSHNSSWELEALKRASPWLRAAVAATVLTPIWITMYAPEQGKEIFSTLKATVPAEWWALFLILCGFAFASKQLIELVKSVKFFK